MPRDSPHRLTITKKEVDSNSVASQNAMDLEDIETDKGPETIHLAITGFGGVGKTALTVQWANKEYYFSEEYDPTVEDVYKVESKYRDKDILVNLIDTSGQEEFFAMRDVYMRDSEAFMLVYAINDRSSFDRIMEIVEHAKLVKDIDSFPVVVVEQKCDLEAERVVTKEEGQQLAASLRAPFVSASAKNGTNIFEAFDRLIKRYYEFNQTQICGWLVKQGGGHGMFSRKNWLRRWFEIDGSTLIYRKGPQATQNLGTVNLDLIQEVSDYEGENDFKVVTPQRTYYLRANNATDKAEWMLRLSNFIR